MPVGLDKLEAALPFPLRAIQIDGGSEFKAEFEAACEQKGIALWVLPPRSPELDGRVERMSPPGATSSTPSTTRRASSTGSTR